MASGIDRTAKVTALICWIIPMVSTSVAQLLTACQTLVASRVVAPPLSQRHPPFWLSRGLLQILTNTYCTAERSRGQRSIPWGAHVADMVASRSADQSTGKKWPLFFPVVDMSGSSGEEPKTSSRTENLHTMSCAEIRYPTIRFIT